MPNNTGYITDIGMTGVIDSVLGVEKNIIIQKMKDKLPVKFYGATGDCELNGCIFDVDISTGFTKSVQRIKVK